MDHNISTVLTHSCIRKILFLNLFLISFIANSQSPFNLIQNPEIKPNFTGYPFNDDFNLGYGLPWEVAYQTPDLNASAVSNPTAAFLGAYYGSLVHESLYSNHFQLQLGKSYFFGMQIKSSTGTIMDSIAVQIVDTTYTNGVTLPSYHGTGTDIVFISGLSNPIYNLTYSCFVAGLSDCNLRKKLWIAPFSSTNDNKSGLLFDNVELIPNFDYVQAKYFSVNCGSSLSLALVDKQVPFYNFTPTYNVYNLTTGGTLVSSSLSFSTGTLHVTTQYVIERYLGYGASTCYGYDTITIEVKPISNILAAIGSINHPSHIFCDGEILDLISVFTSSDNYYYWTLPDGTKITRYLSQYINVYPPQVGWYKLIVYNAPSGCYYVDSVNFTRKPNIFERENIVVPCNINTSIDGDISYDPTYSPTYEWNVLGNPTVINTTRFYTINIGAPIIY